MAMVLDGRVASAPRIRDRITGGRAQITGNFTEEEARDLAIVLAAGSLPGPIQIVSYERIEAVVHPQSIVHSFVEFVDGSLLAQVGEPNMELPILYALTYPDRVEDLALCTFDPVTSSPLTFEEVDRGGFPLFGLGVDAGARGGISPAVFNAANEVAVAGFLERGLGFLEMGDVVAQALESLPSREPTGVQDVLDVDAEARRLAGEAVERLVARKS
jgi:1-deoxy-D-xylulose-5-phosphate reductoisomerase